MSDASDWSDLVGQTKSLPLPGWFGIALAMKNISLLLALATGLLGLQAGFAADATACFKLLAQPILSANQTTNELQAFAEGRVPRMPQVKTVAEWEKIAQQMRRDTFDRIVFRGATAWRNAQTKVEWLETIAGGPGYHIRKLRYEAVPGLWIPALLYEPDNLTGKAPVMLAVNGHDPNGKAAPYKQIRCINLAKRGVISLNVEWFYMGQLRSAGFAHACMNQLDLCGTSGLAPFYLAMSRGLDILLALEHADPSRVAVSGISGGGWQTIFISSLDPRVTLSNPVAGYSSLRTRAYFPQDLGDSEQTPCDLATVTDYAQLTAMRAPRPTLLTYNAKDNCCFMAGYALVPLVEAAVPIYSLYGAPASLRTHINYEPGTHNYEKDNRQAFYGMVGDFFFPKDTKFDPLEIPSDAEVKTNAALLVDLPADNADFNKLALTLCRDLPRDPEIPAGRYALNRWQQRRRVELGAIVHAHDYQVKAEGVDSREEGGVAATYWKLKLGGVWTVPVVELTTGPAKETVVLVSDSGRTNVASEAVKFLGMGKRVVAVDPFYFGELKIPKRDYLYALLLAGVGERPLGLQASEVAATAGKT